MNVDTRAREAAHDALEAVSRMRRSHAGTGTMHSFRAFEAGRRKVQRVTAVLVAVAIAALGFAGLLRAFRSQPLPADEITVDNVANLELVSRVKLEDEIRQGPMLVGSEDVVVVASDRAIAAYPSDCNDPCDPLWRTPPLGQLSLLPRIGGDLLVAGGQDGRAYAFPVSCDSRDGVCDPVWSTPAWMNLGVGPVSRGGFLFASDGHRLIAFPLPCKPTEGVCYPAWRSPALGSVFRVESADDLVVVFTRGGRLLGFSTSCRPTDGVCEPSWKRSLAAAVGDDMIVLDRSVLLSWHRSRLGRIVEMPLSCFGLPDCRPLWTARFRVHKEMGLPGVIVGDDVAAVALMAMNPPNGRILTFPLSCRSDGGECEPLAEIHSNYIPIKISAGVLYTRGYTTGADAYPVECEAPCEALWSDPPDPRRVNHYHAVEVTGDRVFMLSALSGDPGNRLFVFGLTGKAQTTGAGEAP